MPNPLQAAITSVAHYVPEDRLTNDELSEMVDTNDEWIVSHVGIRERRILKDPNLATSYMCTKVAEQLLAQRGIAASEIDLIIVATITPDMVFPATACLVQNDIGAENAWGFDLSAACAGFVYAMTVGAQFIQAGTHKKVLVIGGDKMSATIDYTDRNTCILFGDGAGGVLLEATEDGHCIQDFIFHVDGSGGEHLCQPGGGSLHPASHETVDQRMHFVKQNGRVVMKFASTNMADVSARIIERNGLTSDDIKLLVPHQANRRIILAAARRMKLPEEKILINIDKFGNTTDATVPIALWEAVETKRIERGDYIVMATAGGGYAWGSALIKWAY
jgi:3-oxoacyl-[acyl-carrier-protein] synthase III